MTNSPDEHGYFGAYGGRFVPETLMQPLIELDAAYEKCCQDPEFAAELESLFTNFIGRPTPLTFARRLTEHAGGAKIYLKREDLAHTGAHKINNAVGQILLAQRLGKNRIVAETGAGQHGVATAAAAAHFGMACVIYMGAVDMERQAPNVQRIHLLGAEVRAVHAGSATLKDAISEAMRDWTENVSTTHYLLGSALGPHPYPRIVRDFQSVIGREAREQILAAEERLPDHLVACVGGGSNAIGLFSAFVGDAKVAMTGVEAGGEGVDTGRHAARIAVGSPGMFHGTRTYILQDDAGQIQPTHSVSAGLDYQAIGPEHAMLFDSGRAAYVTCDDRDAVKAFRLLSTIEGIMPALESAHAVSYAVKLASTLPEEAIIVVNLSGRGDKDLSVVEGQE